MRQEATIKLFATTEIIIGSAALLGLCICMLQGKTVKPPQVLAFVFTTSLISAGLGVGLLKLNRHAYHMLLYFSSVIILSKLLIFANIITLSGALETAIPAPLKNTISILYHGLIIIYFSRRQVREKFKTA